MQCGPAFARRVLFKHREINNPKRRPPFGNQAAIFAKLHAQRAKRVIHDTGLVGTKENQVARLRSSALKNAVNRVIGQELQDR